MTTQVGQIVQGVLLVFAALFPIVNPLSAAAIFLAMTSKCSRQRATLVLLRLTAFILLCIGVQIVWNGASALLRTLPG